MDEFGWLAMSADHAGNGPDGEDTPLPTTEATNWSWDYDSCCWAIWDADGRFPTFDSTIQSKVLVYYGSFPNNNANTCTATMIDDEDNDQFASTAAHCVKDSTGAWIYPRGTVCRDGNSAGSTECASVTTRVTNGWSNGPRGKDYALLELNPGGIDVGFMPLSGASNSTIKDNTNYVIGYPVFLAPISPADDPSTASINGPLFGTSPGDCNPAQSPFDADCEMTGFQGAGDVMFTSGDVIGTRLDMGSGMSGGPIFYTPAPSSPFMTGIVSGYWVFTDLNRYNGGPKIPGSTRDWFITEMAAQR